MSKIGLCVRHDCNNYGSMLQIKATQKILLDLGFDYEIIRYDKKTFGFIIKNIPRVLNPYFMRGVKSKYLKKLKFKKHPNILKKDLDRINLFSEYRKKHIGPYSKIYKGYRKLCEGAQNYDIVLVGSDQLWTPAGIKTKFYNLLFVPDNVKKISLATSFGVDEIPKNQINETKKYLERIEYLSVRELNGQRIIKELTDRESVVVLDPTLFYTRKQWEEIFPTQKECDEPYIFAYFLGGNEEHRKAVKELAKKTKLKIISCPHLDEYMDVDENFGDIQRFDVDPINFLNLIRGAEYVCTNSFHGSIFSILNHKKFLAFNRFKNGEKQSRNSRLDSLFTILNIQDRRYDGNIDSIFADINYDDVDKRLANEREKSWGFIKKALDGEDL